MRSPLFYLLLPLAWSYDAATRFRNYLFDRGFKREHTFPLPVITVGNLAVGGTGKTPHTEYLLRLLHEKHNMAMLSRGYRRRTHGYIRATATATAEDIGDEPLQIARKFPNVTVAVDANRCEGIERLMKQRDPKIDALVLDDAFQHRHVRAGLNILLTDYSRLYIDDYLLPAGRLREARGGSGRADIIIVTKCPPTLEADEFEGIARRLRLAREQRLFATTYDYATPSPLFPETGAPHTKAQNTATETGAPVLIITGIANPAPLIARLSVDNTKVTVLSFPDHHAFTSADIRRLNTTFKSLPPEAYAVTTEKDAERLRPLADRLSPRLRNRLMVIPIQVRFLLDTEKMFNETIKHYVTTHQANHSMD